MSKVIIQISVVIENTPGTLSTLSDVLGKEGINVNAITLVESTESSTVRLISDNPDKTEQVLSSRGYQVHKSEVLAIETPDHPGGLNAVLKPLATAGVNVFYLYPYLRRTSGNAIVIFRVSDIEKTIQVLKDNYISILDESIYSI